MSYTRVFISGGTLDDSGINGIAGHMKSDSKRASIVPVSRFYTSEGAEGDLFDDSPSTDDGYEE